jgi:tetratricopeptide (TPR) repeat protein
LIGALAAGAEIAKKSGPAGWRNLVYGLFLSSMSKRSPHPSNVHRPGSSIQVLESAALALRMQRPNEAERLAFGVLKSDRGNVLAARILGRALLMQNRADEAIVALERAARRGDDPEIETLLAGALAVVGRADEALDRLRRSIARRPPFPPAFLEYAGQLGKIGRVDEAIAVLENGLALAPDAVDLRTELGYLHVKRNDRAKAREIFSQLHAAAPERYDVLVGLAKVMALDGEYAPAVDLYRRALGMRPDDAVTRNNLGICQLEMGEREAGEANLRAMTRGAPQLAGQAITSLAAVSHGRFFLRPSAAAKFLGVE